MSQPKTDHSGPMAGRTVLVTGGTNGIGRATAIGLIGLRARVGITGRNPERTRAVAAGIGADAFPADMSSQAQVRRLARDVLAAYPRLEVLVNNVGGYWFQRRITEDGVEHTFAVNHLAPFLLTELLLERLTASAPARIVTVSSGAHTMGTTDFDPRAEREYAAGPAYNQSKLANVLFTYELARRLAGTGVTATVLHPGVVRTGFASEEPTPVWKVGLPLLRPFLKSPARGAATSIYLASSPEVEGVSGTYYVNRRPRRSSPASYDTEAAGRLWRLSEELVA